MTLTIVRESLEMAVDQLAQIVFFFLKISSCIFELAVGIG